jgi:hypothetical protein
MMDWFKAGGFGMFPILAVGMFAIGVGVRAAIAPTTKRIALLGSLLSLIVMLSLFTFGTNLWAVNEHLSSPASVEAASAAAGRMSYIGLLGVTESGQAFTLGGLLATIAAALRAVAAWRNGPDAA